MAAPHSTLSSLRPQQPTLWNPDAAEPELISLIEGRLCYLHANGGRISPVGLSFIICPAPKRGVYPHQTYFEFPYVCTFACMKQTHLQPNWRLPQRVVCSLSLTFSPLKRICSLWQEDVACVTSASERLEGSLSPQGWKDGL